MSTFYSGHASGPAIRACRCGRTFDWRKKSTFGIWGGDVLCRKCIALMYEINAPQLLKKS